MVRRARMDGGSRADTLVNISALGVSLRDKLAKTCRVRVCSTCPHHNGSNILALQRQLASSAQVVRDDDILSLGCDASGDGRTCGFGIWAQEKG